MKSTELGKHFVGTEDLLHKHHLSHKQLDNIAKNAQGCCLVESFFIIIIIVFVFSVVVHFYYYNWETILKISTIIIIKLPIIIINLPIIIINLPIIIITNPHYYQLHHLHSPITITTALSIKAQPYKKSLQPEAQLLNKKIESLFAVVNA